MTGHAVELQADRHVTADAVSPAGLYIHIPFCSSICNYCNFNRVLFDAELKRQYVDALVLEIQRAAEDIVVDSVFFGGGTPSLLEPAEVERVLNSCRASFHVTPDAEITLEANPETATVPALAGFRGAGVNRLSVGVQSFRDAELVRLGRVHSALAAELALEAARAAGFINVSLDMMMWLPGQSVQHWLQSVDRVCALGPDHVSLYLLELYPNAPLREEMARSRWSLAPDDDAAEMYEVGMARLDAAGYEQYEISNVARPGHASRHNVKYWSDGEWLGFGCGAHSTRAGVRQKNLAAVGDYVGAIGHGHTAVAETRRLSAGERTEDALVMGLRLTRGIDLEEVRGRYDIDVMRVWGAELAPFIDLGLLGYDDGRLRLTRAGMLLANEVMAVFVGSIAR